MRRQNCCHWHDMPGETLTLLMESPIIWLSEEGMIWMQHSLQQDQI